MFCGFWISTFCLSLTQYAWAIELLLYRRDASRERVSRIRSRCLD
jgi:hypothetical protein